MEHISAMSPLGKWPLPQDKVCEILFQQVNFSFKDKDINWSSKILLDLTPLQTQVIPSSLLFSFSSCVRG